MINISGLTVHFAGHYLFDNVTLSIQKNDRIGLIGRNGAGKSTFLKIIAGEQSAEGTISIPKDYTIGYLHQELVSNSTKTIKNETADSLLEIKSLKTKIEKLTEEISNREDYESKEYLNLIQELTESNDRFEYLGGNTIDAEIEKVLVGLGFTQEDFNKSISTFSGGWQMRVELAKILLNKPDCIMLDEPTNHLDIESIWWLESFLKTYQGIVLLVSHDKQFLDNVTNRTIEISLGKVYDFNLPYSKFIVQKEEIRQQQLKTKANQDRQIAQTERFIERFRAKATLATRVQSKEKMLNKIERIEVEDLDSSSIKFRFPPAPRCGRVVVETEELNKSYAENHVLNNLNYAMERGEKIAFVGKNGEGKTTLSRILAKDITEYSGNIIYGTNVLIGYYAQHQAEMLDADSTVFDIIDRSATGEMRTQVRSLLGAFLFSGDSVYKKVKVLSGGEKSRLSICKLLLQESNLLIMDEPTNHLDMVAKDVLKNALMNYEGSIIIVSHDRSFLQGLTSRTIYFKNQNIKEYPGDINEFIEKQNIESLNALEENKKQKVYTEKTKSNSQLDREEKKKLDRERNRIKRKISQSEEEIAELEIEISELDSFFSSPEYYNNPEKFQDKNTKHKELNEILNTKMEEWEEYSAELDNL